MVSANSANIRRGPDLGEEVTRLERQYKDLTNEEKTRCSEAVAAKEKELAIARNAYVKLEADLQAKLSKMKEKLDQSVIASGDITDLMIKYASMQTPLLKACCEAVGDNDLEALTSVRDCDTLIKYVGKFSGEIRINSQESLDRIKAAGITPWEQSEEYLNMREHYEAAREELGVLAGDVKPALSDHLLDTLKKGILEKKDDLEAMVAVHDKLKAEHESEAELAGKLPELEAKYSKAKEALTKLSAAVLNLKELNYFLTVSESDLSYRVKVILPVGKEFSNSELAMQIREHAMTWPALGFKEVKDLKKTVLDDSIVYDLVIQKSECSDVNTLQHKMADAILNSQEDCDFYKLGISVKLYAVSEYAYKDMVKMGTPTVFSEVLERIGMDKTLVTNTFEAVRGGASKFRTITLGVRKNYPGADIIQIRLALKALKNEGMLKTEGKTSATRWLVA